MVIPTTKLLLMYFGFVSSSTNFFFFLFLNTNWCWSLSQKVGELSLCQGFSASPNLSLFRQHFIHLKFPPENVGCEFKRFLKKKKSGRKRKVCSEVLHFIKADRQN